MCCFYLTESRAARIPLAITKRFRSVSVAVRIRPIKPEMYSIPLQSDGKLGWTWWKGAQTDPQERRHHPFLRAVTPHPGQTIKEEENV